MDALALKLVLTPLLIGAASLAGRRWGPWLSGWLVGFPFTSGPVVLFLALGLGTHFAAASAAGTLIGTASQAAFCLAYGCSTAGRRLWRSVVVGSLAFAALTLVFGRLSLPLPIASVIVFAAIVASLLLMPPSGATDAPTVQPPWWDIPARMVIATGLVLLLTGVAPALGPHYTGLLSPFPLYGAILAVFAQRQAGAAAAIRVLRGLLTGLFGFAAFFLALALLLVPFGIAPALAVAIAITLGLQTIALWAQTRRGRSLTRAGAAVDLGEGRS